MGKEILLAYRLNENEDIVTQLTRGKKKDTPRNLSKLSVKLIGWKEKFSSYEPGFQMSYSRF